MGWFLTLLVLAALAWFLIRWIRTRAESGNALGGRNPLEHGHEGLKRTLPDQRASTEGEAHDQARVHVGAHLKASPGERPAAAGVSDDSDLTGDERDLGHDARRGGQRNGGREGDDAGRASPDSAGSGLDNATLAVPGSPESDARADRELDAATAARAAHDSENTGGTGTAALAGIATAAAAGIAGAAAHDDERSDGRSADLSSERDADDPSARDAGAPSDRDADTPSERDVGGSPGADASRSDGRSADDGITNPPDPDTAGSLELDGRSTDSAASLRGEEAAMRGREDTSGATARTASGTPSGETDSGQSVRDNADTNAPIADAAPGERARDVVDVPAANAAAAEAPSEDVEPEERANAPDESTAGEGGYRDRSIDERSNVVAGTASLAVGGATSVGEAERLPNGRAELRAEYGESSDASRLESGDNAANVREMMKILNLRDTDASRLGISKEEFAQLWQPQGDAPSTLVDDVAGRLRRMLG